MGNSNSSSDSTATSEAILAEEARQAVEAKKAASEERLAPLLAQQRQLEAERAENSASLDAALMDGFNTMFPDEKKKPPIVEGDPEVHWQEVQQEIMAEEKADAPLLQIAQEEASEAVRLRAEVEAINDRNAAQRREISGISEETIPDMDLEIMKQKLLELALIDTQEVKESGYVALVCDEKVKVATLKCIEQRKEVRDARKIHEKLYYDSAQSGQLESPSTVEGLNRTYSAWQRKISYCIQLEEERQKAEDGQKDFLSKKPSTISVDSDNQGLVEFLSAQIERGLLGFDLPENSAEQQHVRSLNASTSSPPASPSQTGIRQRNGFPR